MNLLFYSEAINTLAYVYSRCPETQNAELPKHILKLAINAFADCLNKEMGFHEPDRPVCDCGKFEGPDLGKEEEFYAKNQILDDGDASVSASHAERTLRHAL